MVTVTGDGLHKLQLPFSFIFDESFVIFYICWFQLLKCKNVLLFFDIHDSK